MASFHQPQMSGAGGVTDVRNPAKSMNNSAVSLLQPKARYEGDEVITHAPLPSSVPRTSPSVHSLLITGSSSSTSARIHPAELPTSGSLYVHPFAHPSAYLHSEYSSPDYGTSTSASLTSSSLSTGDSFLRPPSSASFIKMGKGSKDTRRVAASQAHGSGHRWGRSISDGLPQMIKQVSKRGSRLWRTLTRSPQSFNSENAIQNLAPTVSTRTESLSTPSEMSSLHPEHSLRPDPYFYPRNVDLSVYPSLRQTLVAPYPPSSNSGCRPNAPLADSPSTDDSGYDGEDDHPCSVDSAEIGSWKENRTDYIPTIAETQVYTGPRSLRERIGTNLAFKPSSTPSHTRGTRSEVDLRKVIRDARKTSDIGPGISNDPFAASPIRSQDPPFSTNTSPRIKPASVPPQITTKTTPTKGSKASKPKPGHRSSSRTRLDSLDPTKSCIQQSPPLTPIVSPLSLPLPSPKNTESNLTNKQHGSITHFRHPSILPSSADETPVLTPDRTSFSHRRGTTIGSDTDQSPSSMRTLPTLDKSEMSYEQYEECALEEGTSQEAAFYDAEEFVKPNLGGTAGYRAPHITSRVRPLFPVESNAGGKFDKEDDFDTHEGEMDSDIFASDHDLVSLMAEWPLPPRRTLFLDPMGMSWNRVSPELEYFTPGASTTSNRRVRIVGHSSSFPNISAVAQGQAENLSRRSQHVRSEPFLSSAQELPSLPTESVAATLGSTVLENASFPSIIVLKPSSGVHSPVTLVIQATSRADLISFCAFHGDTIITASPSSFVSDAEPLQAHVKIRRRPTGKRSVEHIMTLSVGPRRADPQSKSLQSLECLSTAFPLRLPVILGELAMVIAKNPSGRVGMETSPAHEVLKTC